MRLIISRELNCGSISLTDNTATFMVSIERYYDELQVAMNSLKDKVDDAGKWQWILLSLYHYRAIPIIQVSSETLSLEL